MKRRELVDVALGNAPADVLITGGNVVNVHTAEIYEAGVAIKGDRIAAVGDVEYTRGPETKVLDAGGRYLSPGLVDGHLHMYHSYLGVNEYVQAMLRHGVTATADGFYGQGIVGGKEAIRFFKEAFDRMPIRLIFLVPTLSYLQNRELGLTPTPGIQAEDMFEILEWPGCYGVEEPPYVPIVEKWEEFLDLFDATIEQRKTITGHAAGINWREMQAYAAVGTQTDHETVEINDAHEKTRAGIRLLMRQGSGAFDVPELVRTYTERKIDPRALAMCADLASPEKLLNQGGVDENVRVAIAHGVPPVTAIQMASLNVAEVFFAQRDFGAIAPGRFADIVFVDDLPSFSIQRVLFGGETVVEDGEFVGRLPETTYPSSFFGTVKLPKAIEPGDVEFAFDGGADEVQVRVIAVTDGSLETREQRATLKVEDGVVRGDLEQDVLPLVMIDRFEKGTGIGRGFVRGFSLRRGAIASSVNAVCENLVIVGTNAEDMALAANTLAEIGGGKAVVADGEVLSVVELRLLGLLSEDPLQTVMEKFGRAFAAIADLGCTLTNPFSQLEFCFACGEIGDIKLSEEGLLLVRGSAEKVDVLV